MWEISVQSPGWEDPLEEGMATHSGILAWRISMDRGAWGAAVHGVAKLGTTERPSHSTDNTHAWNKIQKERRGRELKQASPRHLDPFPRDSYC